MSEVVPHKKTIARGGKVREYRAPPERLDFAKRIRTVKVRLSNGSEGRGTCLGCKDAPCMTLGIADTLLPEALSDFPGDPAREVCPTRALSWNDNGLAIVVKTDTCIGCGLCLARCPYGAISLSAEGKAIVEVSDPDHLTVACTSDSTLAEHPKPQRVGQIGPIETPVLRNIPESVARIGDVESLQFVRNLLIACGIECRTRRKGDTNIRIDGVLGLADGRLGVLEIELGYGVLDSPRALLEDVAILHARYGVDVQQIDPVSVILGLPNARSEYFQVIADIEKVLGLRCRTITIGALLAIMWQFQIVEGFSGELFMTLPGETDLSPAIKKFISASISAEQPYPGSYRPSK
jgi:Fe-S-cluster-containing hydrogenase component 2